MPKIQLCLTYLLLTLSLTFTSVGLSQEAKLASHGQFLDYSKEEIWKVGGPKQIYAGRNTRLEPLAKLEAGQLVWSTRSEEGWLFVYDSNSAQKGWVMTPLLVPMGLSSNQAQTINKLSDDAYGQLNSKESTSEQRIASFQNVVRKMEEFGHGETPLVCGNLQVLFEQFAQSNNFSEAKKVVQREFEILSRFLGQNDMRTVHSKIRLARSFAGANEQSKRLKLFQEALVTTAKILGENNEIYLSILFSVGQSQIDIDKRLATFAKCAELSRKHFGETQIAAFYLMRYADQAIFSNQADAAIVALKQAMESFGDSEPNDPRLAEAFMFLGRAHLELSDRQQATANLEKAIKIFRKDNTNITSQKSLARALVWLAGTFSDYRDYAGSIKHLEEAASIFEKNEDPWTIDALESLAFSQSELGLYSRAEATCQRAAKFSQKIDRPDLNNQTQHVLGMIYQATGKLDEAKKLLRETLDFNIRVVGRENSLRYLHNYADVLFDCGELNAAYAIHEDNYKIRKEKFGNHHNCTQSSLLALADISLLRHEYVDAKRYLSIALEAHSERGRSDFEGG